MREQRAKRRARQPTFAGPEEGDGTVVVQSRRTEYLIYGLGSGGFAAAGVFFIVTEKAAAVGWVTVLFFGLGALVLLGQLLDPRPRLLIDRRGVYDRTLGVGWVAWADVEAAWLRSVHGIAFLCLEVRDPDKYLRRLSRWRRAVGRLNRAFGFSELYLNLSGVAPSPEQVARLVERHLNAARQAIP